MKYSILIASTAAALALAAPAQAQLIGGLTGGLDKAISGTLSSRVDSRLDKSFDRRSGRASARGSADGMLGGTLEGVTGVTGPHGKASSSKSVRAEKRVSKSASVEAGGPGTDDAGSVVGGLASTARGAATGAVGAGQGAARSVAGGAAGSGSGSASGSGHATAGDGLLAGGGTLGGSATGAGALEVGTLVRDAKGRAVGRIEELRDGAQTVLVDVGKHMVELPAGSFSANGEFTTSAMSRAEIRKMAKAQERDGASPSS